MNITGAEIEKLTDNELWNLIDNLLDHTRARMQKQVAVSKATIENLERQLPRSNY